MTMSLRNELLATCYASGATMHECMQAAVDVILFSICMAAPDEHAAERDIANITAVMREGIRQGYRDYQVIAESQRATMQ